MIKSIETYHCDCCLARHLATMFYNRGIPFLEARAMIRETGFHKYAHDKHRVMREEFITKGESEYTRLRLDEPNGFGAFRHRDEWGISTIIKKTIDKVPKSL